MTSDVFKESLGSKNCSRQQLRRGNTEVHFKWTLLLSDSFVLNIVVIVSWVVIFSPVYGLLPTKGVDDSPPATLMKSSPVALYTSIYLFPMWCLCLLRAISRWETFSNSTKASPFLLPCGDKQRATPGMGKFQWRKIPKINRQDTKGEKRVLLCIIIYVLFCVFTGEFIWLVLRWVFMVGFYGGILNWVLVLNILTFLPSQLTLILSSWALGEMHWLLRKFS